MSNESEGMSALFKEIPSAHRTPEQVARWERRGESPTYRLLRNPVDLQEINRGERPFAIWIDNNKTLTYVSPRGCFAYPDGRDQRYLWLNFRDHGPSLTIFGRTDRAIAKTAAFILGLERPTEECTKLTVTSNRDDFDFRSAGPQCLTHILGVVPLRTLTLMRITLSVDQSIVLATSPYRMSLSLLNVDLADGGTAFITELVNRTSSFGSLVIDSDSLNEDSFVRLLSVRAGIIDHLELRCETDRFGLLPLSVKVESLMCWLFIPSSSALDVDFQSLDVVARKFCLTIGHPREPFSTDLMISFWRRVAELGHFDELDVALHGRITVVPARVVPEVIRAVLANRNLKVLRLGRPKWGPHVEALFNALKDHSELRTLAIAADAEDFGPGFLYLRKLLIHNKNITVLDHAGKIVTDGLYVDKLYDLNSYYRNFADLVKRPSAERHLLVATCLIESAANDFQRSVLLLANYTDSLRALVQFADLDAVGVGEILLLNGNE